MPLGHSTFFFWLGDLDPDLEELPGELLEHYSALQDNTLSLL